MGDVRDGFDEASLLEGPAERELRESNDMLATLSRVQSQFIVDGNPRDSFNELLTEVLRLTESAYGFIGEVFTDDKDQPYLKAHAITNISWNPETRAIFEKSSGAGFEFRNLRTLFGAVITAGQAVIANNPGVDPRRGGLPAGHPALEAFAGLPFSRNGRMLGMIGIANRAAGYDDNIVKRLEPFLSTCASLTEAYRSERLRKQSDEALGAAHAQLAAALHAGGIGLWTWHPSDNRVTWDKSAVELLGRPLSEPGNLAEAELIELTVPEDRPRLRAALQAVMTQQADLDLEFRVIRPDGRLLWIAAKGKIERDVQGQPIRMANAAVDITQRKTLEEQLRQVQKMEAIGQLAGGIAHDFNNLLNVIEMNASLMKDTCKLEPESRESVDAISQATRSAANLTRQLLTFGRRQMVRLHPLNINQVVESVGTMLKRTLRDDVQLVIRCAEDLPLVEADAGMLEQVLLNLSVNAHDAMPTAGQLTIETSLTPTPANVLPSSQASDMRVRLTVTDTGTGIAPEHRDRVFEPFFTTKDVGKGTGLGLAMVYGIVKQHQGLIAIRTEVGRGSSFDIFLNPLPPEAKAAPDETPAPAPRRGHATILVVEDQDQLRALVSSTLRLAGYTILQASSGQEALATWHAHQARIDLLLTDMVMPGGMSGLDVATRLRELCPSLKVIFTSGYSPEALASQGDPFLQKPYEASALVRLVRTCLDGSGRSS